MMSEDMVSVKGEGVPPEWVIPRLSEIAEGLFMGMRPKSYIGYDLVVSCEEYLAKGPMDNYDGTTVHLPMRDLDDFPLLQSRIDPVAGIAFEAWRYGGQVLIHCSGGLNRSGVVTAHVLMMGGATAQEAVYTLRERRDAYVLCNPAFERFVLGEEETIA
jgi:protein-tyrosine phosphatase